MNILTSVLNEIICYLTLAICGKKGVKKMIKTRITEMLGIKYPIFQGAMGYISDYHLVSAVSNAGGAGVIATGGRDGAWTKEQIRLTKELTDKPFGVNIALSHRNLDIERMIDIVCEEEVVFVTVGAGNPIPFIERLHSAGVKVVGIIPSTRLAKKTEAAGIDMIIIEGTEAGGRIGRLTTMSLMSNVIPEVKIPVMAAGGICDGRGLAAALIMGAEGIQMGTRFLVSEECVVHPQYKEEIIKASDTNSVSIGLSRNKGTRGLRSPYTEKYTEMEISGVSTEELGLFFKGVSRKVAEEGLGEDGMNGIIQCSQAIEQIREIKTVKQIIEDTMKEAEELLLNALSFVK